MRSKKKLFVPLLGGLFAYLCWLPVSWKFKSKWEVHSWNCKIWILSTHCGSLFSKSAFWQSLRPLICSTCPVGTNVLFFKGVTLNFLFDSVWYRRTQTQYQKQQPSTKRFRETKTCGGTNYFFAPKSSSARGKSRAVSVSPNWLMTNQPQSIN